MLHAFCKCVLQGNLGTCKMDTIWVLTPLLHWQVMGWVNNGLKDFSLSRAKVEWGIRVPWDNSQTFYVWTDALMGYMTGKTPSVSLSASLSVSDVAWAIHSILFQVGMTFDCNL